LVRVILEPDRGQRVPVRLWGRSPDPAAVRQLQRIASQPYVVLHVAGMPDLHVAEGVAVGTVFATDDRVVPVALGGDLGCGMSALRFDTPAASLGKRVLETILNDLGNAIPVGDAFHRGRGTTVPEELLGADLSTSALCHARDRMLPRHHGTLGGGNHFVELDRDAGGSMWLLVHTGSRGLGGAVRAHHGRAAEDEGAGDLPALLVGTPGGDAYVADLTIALSVARANRRAILDRAIDVLGNAGISPEPETLVDLHHNFLARETHFGREVWVHRKGAIAAPEGEVGLIPGSMGTASYLVVGRGEPWSLGSASHGAGRVLPRGVARRVVSPAALERSMRRVVFDRRRVVSLVEEAPAAYREIGEVLEDEEDLVTPMLRLEPIAVLKG
jgi:tRNA-splicing ligase RtcB (3'-phosphate/5'-hydroxy nucleic acid ligase)